MPSSEPETSAPGAVGCRRTAVTSSACVSDQSAAWRPVRASQSAMASPTPAATSAGPAATACASPRTAARNFWHTPPERGSQARTTPSEPPV